MNGNGVLTQQWGGLKESPGLPVFCHVCLACPSCESKQCRPHEPVGGGVVLLHSGLTAADVLSVASLPPAGGRWLLHSHPTRHCLILLLLASCDLSLNVMWCPPPMLCKVPTADFPVEVKMSWQTTDLVKVLKYLILNVLKRHRSQACIQHTSIHTYIHTYIHTFIHTYIHTYIHTNLYFVFLSYCWWNKLIYIWTNLSQMQLIIWKVTKVTKLIKWVKSLIFSLNVENEKIK